MLEEPSICLKNTGGHYEKTYTNNPYGFSYGSFRMWKSNHFRK